MKNHAIVVLLGLAITSTPAPAAANTSMQCMQDLLDTGANSLTLGEIRSRCQSGRDGDQQASDNKQDLVLRRVAADRGAAGRPFSIQAHKPNYILAGAYNQKGWDSSLTQQALNDPNYENRDVEMQFQVSLKVPLALNLFNDSMDLYFAYTNRSFWQVYNSTNSEPFRETNHEPEIWGQFYNDWNIWGFSNAVNAVGFVHQSNGRTEPLSRSWNRIYANFIFENEDWVLSFKPWIWISGNKESSDNPDIDDYMGYGEIRGAWARDGQVLSIMIRNQFESGFERGATEFSWSFPVFDYPYLKGYLQYFYGYGESLIDYDNKVNRIGLGISVSDWLH